MTRIGGFKISARITSPPTIMTFATENGERVLARFEAVWMLYDPADGRITHVQYKRA